MHKFHHTRCARAHTQTMSVDEIVGNLLTVKADYIVHQANCLTVKSHGLAAAIFVKYPAANCYARRTAVAERNLATPETRDKPGTIKIDGRVVHLFAQWAPGRVDAYPSYPAATPAGESAAMRVSWFTLCLTKLEQELVYQCSRPVPGPTKVEVFRTVTVAFPCRIGSDLAGGDWNVYRGMLLEFAQRVQHVAKVLIVRLPTATEKRKREE